MSQMVSMLSDSSAVRLKCVIVYSPNQRKNALVGCSERPNGHLSLLHLQKHCIYA